MIFYDSIENLLTLMSFVVVGVTHYRESKCVAFQPTKEAGSSIENRNLFFNYMADRHRIWRRRFLEKKPPPWTKNPIFLKYKFTNVFRRHDRCSQYLLSSISKDGEKRGKPLSKQEIAWRIILFRFINRIETFEDIGMPRRKHFDIREFCKRLRELKESDGGRSVFTSAYITCQCSNKRDRIGNFEEMMGGIHENWPRVWGVIQQAQSMKEAYKSLQQFYGLGQFNSYEICIDLCYTGVFSDKWRDEFANPGPGCKVGIDWMYPFGTIDYHEAMRKLTDKQEKYFAKAAKGPRLTLQDIEFNLCEFGKYMKIVHRVGKSRMHFNPITSNDVWIF